MKLMGFKGWVISGLMLFVLAGWIPLMLSESIIHPFPLTPNADVEAYNYAWHIIVCLNPILLLSLLYACLYYLSRVNIDNRLNTWIKKSTKDIRKVVLAVLIYQVKELFDYLIFENVIPGCFDGFWFMIFWEFLPVAFLMLWAVYSANNGKHGTK